MKNIKLKAKNIIKSKVIHHKKSYDHAEFKSGAWKQIQQPILL